MAKRLWEEREALRQEVEQFRSLGTREKISEALAYQQRLLKAALPEDAKAGPAWTEDQRKTRDDFYKLFPELAPIAQKLKAEHLDTIEALHGQRDHLGHLAHLPQAIEQMHLQDVSPAIAGLHKLASDRGLTPTQHVILEDAVERAIGRNPRALSLYLDGTPRQKQEVVEAYAAQVIKETWGDAQIKRDAALQRTKETLNQLPGAPARGGRPGGSSSPAKPPDDDGDFDHDAAMTMFKQVSGRR